MGSDFVLSGSISKEILKSMKKYLYPPSFIRFINITIIISGLLSFLFLLLRIQPLTILFLIGALFIYIEKILCRKVFIKKFLRSISPEQTSFNYKLHFRNDCLTISQENEENGFDINYSNISRIAETKKYIALFTHESMCLPIYKTSFNSEEKYEWLVYIMAKSNKIRLYNIQ
ncbi:YcxB family protein [Lacrimispora sp.]|uniref:YcxB family protein n=1 Tax=Lacrimispora sp. TaxID=2719234 RepID=UPI0032E4ECBE